MKIGQGHAEGVWKEVNEYDGDTLPTFMEFSKDK